MAYSNVSDTQLLDPTTGQYYTEQVYTPPSNNFFGMGSNGGGIANNYGFSMLPQFGLGGIPSMPMTRRQYTGDVSQVFKMMQNKQPYQYNVPSIASMFSSMAMPTMGNYQPSQYTGGVGQFLGGLLGNAPMANNNAAPAAQSSGAGRFA
jgi:hypothetical protein